MKANLHPRWYPKAIVSCACGNTFTVGSTVKQIQVEICHKCHPYYTGEIKYVDTLGRVDKFKQKQQLAEKLAAKRQAKLAKEKSAKEKAARTPKTLKEMLQAIK